jgi:predicted Fe-Mo cluster-binding NifX family protein
MKIVVTAEGKDLNAPTSSRFGRCPTYIFIESESMAFKAVPNPAISAPGGAGIQAAQFVVEQGAKVALTANVGPNAMDVLQAAGVSVYMIQGGSVLEAVEAYKAGQLQSAMGANVQSHTGMRGGDRPAAPNPSREQEVSEREQEVSDLKTKAADLRRQLAEIVERIEKLEKEN